jgi:hypothetical protein
MTATGFALNNLFADGLPAPAPRWTGFPKYNFIGGHNDPERVPAADLAAAAASVLRRDGADLALYNPHGPQGFRGIREFVVDKVKYVSYWQKILVYERDKDPPYVLVKLRSFFRNPEFPFSPPHDEACVRKGYFSLGGQVSAYMVRMPMCKNDCVNFAWRDPFSP